MLDKVNKFVKDSFGRDNVHLERTLYWAKVLDPDASEELLIAAASHDIERAFNFDDKNFKGFNDGPAMEKHQAEGGRIIYDFLVEQGYDLKKAERVRELISKHEVGGDEEQDILKDADSLSYLEVNAPRHINFIRDKGFSKDEVRKKFNSMYERISSPVAKESAIPFYDKALKLLEEYSG